MYCTWVPDLRNMAEDAHEEFHRECEPEEKAEPGHSHAHIHGNGHGHGHGHGHSHGEVPQSISSVAWMVIMGDGLHNFSDGLAIGECVKSYIQSGCNKYIEL